MRRTTSLKVTVVIYPAKIKVYQNRTLLYEWH